MLEEKAHVIAVHGELAWVETQRRSACDACSAKQGCGTGVLSMLFGKRNPRLKVRNPVGAVVGEKVIVGIEDSMLVSGSFAVYIVPLLLLLGGAVFGEMSEELFGMPGSEGLTVVFGLGGLISGFVWLRYHTGRIGKDRRYQASILRKQEMT